MRPNSDPMQRCSQRMLECTLGEWGGSGDLWVFGYASLIWRPEGEVKEVRSAKIHGHHRALQMWSTVNRGTPGNPGLVFALVSGGSCQGVVQRIAQADVPDFLPLLWLREMPNPVYDAKWVKAETAQGVVRALAFTLCRQSPSYTGHLPEATYRHIFRHATGRYGSTLSYAQQTHDHLLAMGINDRALERLLRLSCTD
jgi:cation transport protein ChaC